MEYGRFIPLQFFRIKFLIMDHSIAAADRSYKKNEVCCQQISYPEVLLPRLSRRSFIKVGPYTFWIRIFTFWLFLLKFISHKF